MRAMCVQDVSSISQIEGLYNRNLNQTEIGIDRWGAGNSSPLQTGAARGLSFYPRACIIQVS
jgi:hypothetical protein